MALVSIPTSADISIEINGQKVAAAQSYRVQSVRESRYIEAFGSSEPVGTVGGRVQHKIELSRVCLCQTEGIDFYSRTARSSIPAVSGRTSPNRRLWVRRSWKR